MENLHLRQVTVQDADVIFGLASQVYPELLIPELEAIRRIAHGKSCERPWPQRWKVPSFLLCRRAVAIGYLLATRQESEFSLGDDVVCLWDMAILPKYRGSTAVREMVAQVLDVASCNGVAVEARLRENTSYALLRNPSVLGWLRKRGFWLTAQRPIGTLSERFHHVRYESG